MFGILDYTAAMSSFSLQFQQDGQASEFKFDQPAVSIGRDKTSGFVLDHPTVSRQHAQIVNRNGAYRLLVLSRNGFTAIDGVQVSGDQPIYDGSEIHLGQLKFTFRSDDAAPLPDEAATTQAIPIVTSAPVVDDNDDLVSWEEIAKQADELEDEPLRKSATDFERMERAQRKAVEASQGNNPIRLAIAGILIAGLLVWILMPQNKLLGGGIEEEDDPLSGPVIDWPKNSIECVGAADCEAKALNAYKVGKITYERKNSDIVNLYESYRQLDKAEKLLAKGGVSPLPAQMGDLPELKTPIEEEMAVLFQQHRVRFRDLKARKMYKEMARTLNEIAAYFPDSNCKYKQWANREELEMKNAGTYPITVPLR